VVMSYYNPSKVGKTKDCHGCGGRGWVVVSDKPHRCPVCFGRGFLYLNPNSPVD